MNRYDTINVERTPEPVEGVPAAVIRLSNKEGAGVGIRINANEALVLVLGLCNALNLYETVAMTLTPKETPEDVRLAALYRGIEAKLKNIVKPERSDLEKDVARFIAGFLSIDLMEDEPFDTGPFKYDDPEH